jgi:hypothetical protein
MVPAGKPRHTNHPAPFAAYTDHVMTMAHAAAGAAIAHGSRSRVRAVVAALAAHALLDLPRHEDLEMREEGVLTLTTIGVCAALFGIRSREFWGAFLCSSPDLEHVLRPGRRAFFPTHRFGRLHGLVPTPIATAPAQVAAAGATLAIIAARRRHAA